MASPQDQRLKAIDIAIGQIAKQHGSGTVLRLGDRNPSRVPSISTGAVMMDYALGVNGIPRGRITEIYGPEASGNTALALQVIAQAQKAGGYGAFIDAEHAFDAKYARALRINTDELLVSPSVIADRSGGLTYGL